MGYVQYLVHGAVVIIGDLVAGVRVLIGDLELGGSDVHAGAADAEGSLQSIGDRADAGLLNITKILQSFISTRST